MASSGWRGVVIAFSVLLFLVVVGVATTGFFVVQPIGMLEDGITIWYWRAGTSMKFISSADGISLDTVGSVSLLTRSVALGQALELVNDRTILRLPYMRALYLRSTGGREFDR